MANRFVRRRKYLSQFCQSVKRRSWYHCPIGPIRLDCKPQGYGLVENLDGTFGIRCLYGSPSLDRSAYSESKLALIGINGFRFSCPLREQLPPFGTHADQPFKIPHVVGGQTGNRSFLFGAGGGSTQ